MTSEAQKRASEKYDRNNTVQLHLKLNKKTDADVLQILDAVDNKQGFVKDLIRIYSAGILMKYKK